MSFELREWSIIGGVSLALFGLYSYKHSASNSKPLFEVPESYEMIRPTEVSNFIDLSGRTVIHRTNKKLDARVPQKANTPVAKVEDPKKLAADKKKKEEEAKKKAQALKDAQKKKFDVKVVGESNKSTFDEGFEKSNNPTEAAPQFVGNYQEQAPTQDDADPKEKEKPKTIAQWEKIFFSATLDKNAVKDFVAAHKKHEISEAEFSNLVWKMLHDQSHAGEKRKLALTIMESDMTYATFAIAVKFQPESQGESRIDSMLTAFKKNVNVLGLALNSKDSDVRGKGFEYVEALIAGFSVGSQGAHTPRSPANVSLAAMRQLLSPLGILLKHPDAAIREQARNLTDQIESLKS